MLSKTEQARETVNGLIERYGLAERSFGKGHECLDEVLSLRGALRGAISALVLASCEERDATRAAPDSA